jgi:hypothetical protein
MRSTGARIAMLVVLIAVAVGLFLVLSGDDDNGDDNDSTTTSAQTTTGGEPSTPAVKTITVKDGMPVGGIQKIEVNKGDTVTFKVVSENVTDEVHVHGYDLMQDVAPGEPVTFDFPADIEGVFEAELEDAHQQILELRVNP